MLSGWIALIILNITSLPEYKEIPPNLIGAIIIKESNQNEFAYHKNRNGSYDYGLMQLNSSSFPGINLYYLTPEQNVYLGIRLFKQYKDLYNLNYWQALIMYNCGPTGFTSKKGNPPIESIQYANDVFEIWDQLDRVTKMNTLIKYGVGLK